MAALMPVFITERYRLAAAPGLLLLGVGGLWALWENLTFRAWGKVSLQPALIALCTWFASQPQHDISLWSLDFYKAGIRNTDGATDALKQAGYLVHEAGEAQARGDAEAARKDHEDADRQNSLVPKFLGVAQNNLETAYRYVPNNAEIAFALGNVWYYEKDNAKAKLCFERALQISAAEGRPHDGALNNLGAIAMDENRPKDAQRLFQRSLQTEPEDAKTWFRLATACRDQGDIAHAEMAIAQAIKLNGKEPAFQKFRDELRKPAPPSPAPK
jgi:tetratricopeptide (TPR) repeat protein